MKIDRQIALTIKAFRENWLTIPKGRVARMSFIYLWTIWSVIIGVWIGIFIYLKFRGW